MKSPLAFVAAKFMVRRKALGKEKTQYIVVAGERFLNLLKCANERFPDKRPAGVLRFPSVSTQSEHTVDMIECANG
jgi:hypothetical protein